MVSGALTYPPSAESEEIVGEWCRAACLHVPIFPRLACGEQRSLIASRMSWQE
jgi:hypothetical protein